MKHANINTVETYAKLENEKAELEESLRAIKKRLDQLREPVLQYFQSHNTQRWNGFGRTLYLRRELWAGREEGVEVEDAITALHSAGLDEFAKPKISHQALSAYLREMDEQGELDEQGRPLAGPLRGVFRANETWKIGSKRS